MNPSNPTAYRPESQRPAPQPYLPLAEVHGAYPKNTGRPWGDGQRAACQGCNRLVEYQVRTDGPMAGRGGWIHVQLEKTTCATCGEPIHWAGTVDPGWVHDDFEKLRSGGAFHAATPAGGE